MNELSLINHQKAAFDARYYTLDQLKAFHQKAHWGVKCAAVASWLLLSFFIAGLFAGSEPEFMQDWRIIQYVYAVMGVLLATVLTIAEVVLFNSGKVREYLLVTALSMAFGVFAEVSATMQREQSAVKFKSQQSDVFKATLNAANQLTRPTLSSAQLQLANAQALLSGAANAQEKGIIQHRIDRLQNQVNLEQAANANLLTTTLATAKHLEYDEANHQAMIRLLSETFGVSHVQASAFLAFFLIITFKACFHYLGSMRNTSDRAINIKQGHIADVFEYSPERPSLSHSPASPAYGLLHGSNRATTDVTRVYTGANTGDASTRDTGLGEPKPNADKTAMEDRYLLAMDKNAGESVECPTCSALFKKKMKTHYFCKAGCKDIYWNVIRPERLIEARAGAGK